LNDEEKSAAITLYASKYSLDKWNFKKYYNCPIDFAFINEMFEAYTINGYGKAGWLGLYWLLDGFYDQLFYVSVWRYSLKRLIGFWG
jgi:hypothetical protein